MRPKQIVHGKRIQFFRDIIDLDCVFDLLNLTQRRGNTFSVQDFRDMFLGQRVALDRQSCLNRPDLIRPAEFQRFSTPRTERAPFRERGNLCNHVDCIR